MLINWRTSAAFQFARQWPRSSSKWTSLPQPQPVLLRRVLIFPIEFTLCNSPQHCIGVVWTLCKKETGTKKNSDTIHCNYLPCLKLFPQHSHRSAATTTATATAAAAVFSRVVITSGRASVCMCVFVFAFDENYCRSPPWSECEGESKKREKCKRIEACNRHSKAEEQERV